MSFVILGFLHYWPMSLYDLMRAFRAGVSLFYGSSAGSLKRALDKLLREGSVEISHQEPGIRGRREYSITPLGRQRFQEWMEADFNGESDSSVTARLFFLGLISEPEREVVLRRLVLRVCQDLAELEGKQLEIAENRVPQGMEDVSRFHLSVLEYGISELQHRRSWFSDLYTRETGLEPPSYP